MNVISVMKRFIRWMLIVAVAVSAHEYARLTIHREWTAEAIVMGLEGRPFVYRTLVPWLAHLLVWTGLSPDMALTIVVVLSAIGAMYGIQYLFRSFRRP